ncbi:MAG: hypothetical protein AAFY29_23220 [Pseudomonadota bacterium]
MLTGGSIAESNLLLTIPERIDEHVARISAAPLIDVFFDQLDTFGLGLNAEPADADHPGYHPRTMLKILIYGYMAKAHSLRRLQAEAFGNHHGLKPTGISPSHRL